MIVVYPAYPWIVAEWRQQCVNLHAEARAIILRAGRVTEL